VHRGVVDGPGLELAAAAAFEHLIQAEHDGPLGHEGLHQQAQEHPGGLPGRPARPVEHAVVGLETGLLGQAQGAQRGGKGMIGGGRQYAAEQGLRAEPTGLSKQGGKRRQYGALPRRLE
jgi:hypothetical protein